MMFKNVLAILLTLIFGITSFITSFTFAADTGKETQKPLNKKPPGVRRIDLGIKGVDIINNAVKSYKEKRYTEAIDYATQAIELNPNYSYVYYIRGLAYYEAKKYPESLKDLTRAISLIGIPSPNYFLARGYTYMDSGQYENAIKDLEDALRLFKERIKEDNSLDEDFKKINKRLEELDKSFEKIAGEDKNPEKSDKTLKEIAERNRILREKERREKEEPILKIAEIQNNIGVCYARWASEEKEKKNFGKAREYYKKAIEAYSEAINLNPKDPLYSENKKTAERALRSISFKSSEEQDVYQKILQTKETFTYRYKSREKRGGITEMEGVNPGDISVSYRLYRDELSITKVHLPSEVSRELSSMANKRGFGTSMNLDLPFYVWFTKIYNGNSDPPADQGEKELAIYYLEPLSYLKVLLQKGDYETIRFFIDKFLNSLMT